MGTAHGTPVTPLRERPRPGERHHQVAARTRSNQARVHGGGDAQPARQPAGHHRPGPGRAGGPATALWVFAQVTGRRCPAPLCKGGRASRPRRQHPTGRPRASGRGHEGARLPRLQGTQLHDKAVRVTWPCDRQGWWGQVAPRCLCEARRGLQSGSDGGSGGRTERPTPVAPSTRGRDVQAHGAGEQSARQGRDAAASRPAEVSFR